MSNPEALHKTPEHTSSPEELEAINLERREALRDKLERAEAKHATEVKDTAKEALAEAQQAAKEKQTTPVQREASPAERRGPISKKQREASFHSHMHHIQADMTPSSRAFSKFIHNKAVEKTSDFLGATVARPNALLAASIFAFLTVTALYLIAKNYGYTLSGFETLGAGILGWILGLMYDYLRVLMSGKSNS